MCNILIFLVLALTSTIAATTNFDNETTAVVSHRQSRAGFPFYTVGRFENTVCFGSNQLIGSCVLNHECDDRGGTRTGNFACSMSLSKQAECCILTRSCGTSTNFNNTYFTNAGYPSVFIGGSRCNIQVTRSGTDVCQLRVDFLDFELAQPTGDGVCSIDYFEITGGSTTVPRICGKNTGQHVYINFADNNPLTVTVATSGSFTYNRRWNLQLQMIGCDSTSKAPEGCLQYWQDESTTISSFNYDSTGAGTVNSIGVQGTRQLSNVFYGACVRAAPGACTITWSLPDGDPYAFTVTGDVEGVAVSLLGSDALQQTNCDTDFVTIPAASLTSDITMFASSLSPGDRFCGLGWQDTTSNVRPFVIYSYTNANESPDIGNRGWSLTYTQNMCPINVG